MVFFFILFALHAMLHGIFNYSRDTQLYRCLTLYSIDMSTAYIHRRNQIRTFCHACYTSVYPQNFEVMKFSWQIDCYHMLFISGWLMRHRYAFRKLSVGFGQRSLKWLKYIHFNRVFRHISRVCSFAFICECKFIPMLIPILIKLNILQRYGSVQY